MARKKSGPVARVREAIKWTMNHHGGKIGANHPSRHDLQAVPLGGDAHLNVYWKQLDIGHGPAVSVVVHEEEILRVDCFGPDDGHMHAAFFMPGSGENRLYFPENTREAQIERAVFEITTNLRYYLDRAVDPRIRAVELDSDRVADAAEEARRIMMGYLQGVPSLASD